MIKRVVKGHPMMIFSYMYPYLFVLVLPLVRSGIQYLRYKQTDGLLLWESIVFALLLTLAVLKWKRFSLKVSDDAVVIKSGILLRRTAVIPKKRVSCICSQNNPVSRLLRFATVFVNTEAGRMGSADFSFKLYTKDLEFAGLDIKTEDEAKTVRFSAGEVIFMAASSSSALGGLIVAVPIINKAAKLLGNSIVNTLMKTVSDAEKLFNGLVPPIVNLVTAVFILGYIVAFIIAFCRYFGFRVTYTKEGIEIRSGLIVKYLTKFRRSAVNNICIEQNIVFRMFSRYNVSVSVGGYGQKRSEMAVIVPSGGYSEATGFMKRLYSDFSLCEKKVRPPEGSRYRFYFLPCLWLLAFPAVSTWLSCIFPVFEPFFTFFFSMASLVVLYYLSLGEHNYKKSEVVFGDFVFARSTYHGKIKELYCKRNKIGLITIRRFPADRTEDTCNLKMVIRSEGADHITVKHISYSGLISVLDGWTDCKLKEN